MLDEAKCVAETQFNQQILAIDAKFNRFVELLVFTFLLVLTVVYVVQFIIDIWRGFWVIAAGEKMEIIKKEFAS